MSAHNAAIIGAGRIGMLLEDDPKRVKPATHAGMWSSNERTRLAAVCDSDPEKLKAVAKFGDDIATFTDPKQLLVQTKPDIVSIATPNEAHFEMTKLAIEHGVSVVICEKPISDDLAHAEEVVALAREKGTKLIIHHSRRFEPMLYTLKEDIAKGLLGEMLQASTYYVYGLVSTGTHLVDTLRFLFNDVAGEIAWVAGYPNNLDVFEPSDDSCVDGIIAFESGFKVTLQSLNMKDYNIFDFYLYGRKGKAVYRNVSRDIDIYPVVEAPGHAGFTELSQEPLEHRGGEALDFFSGLGENAVDCLEGKAEPLSTGEDSVIALKVLLAIRESAEAGGMPVTLK